MTFDGSGSAATIIGDGPTAILVRGTLTIRNFTDFSITGTIFALDGVTFENIDHLQLLGSVVTNGDLTFNAVEMEAEFDPSITSTPPEEVTGGERGRTLAELWRIPHNSATDPSIASDAASGSPPPDDDLTIFGDLHDILDGSADETDSAADSSGASSPGRRSAKPHPRVSSSRPPGHIAARIPFC